MPREHIAEGCKHPEESRLHWDTHMYSCNQCGATPSEILMGKILEPK